MADEPLPPELEFLRGMPTPIEVARRQFEAVMEHGTAEQKEAMLVAIAQCAGDAGIIG